MPRPAISVAVALVVALVGVEASAQTGLTVSGPRLLRDGKPFRVHGVNHAGAEFACARGSGIFDGPVGDALVVPMKAWNIDAVRLPLNEDCWLGINGVATAFAGEAYQAAVVALIDRFHAHGMVVILDLHWSAAGTTLATSQAPMADADHSVAFWSSVATKLKDDREVMFDLYNEPHDVSWACWRDGCSDPGFRAAGMQTLVDAVRAAGAKQPLLIGGLAWSNDLSGWLAHAPLDPEKSLVASMHAYNFNTCRTRECWDGTIAPLALEVPVLLGEVGEDDCSGTFLTKLLPWADAHGIGYLGWTWNPWDCKKGPALITDYDGTPTPFGRAFRAHLRKKRRP